jgi:predicted PilT family ATPase
MAARKRPTEFVKELHTFLFHRSAAAVEKKAQEKVSKGIRSYVREHGTVQLNDDGEEITGNIEYRVPKPIDVGGKLYYGMELRKQTSIQFDYTEARRLAEELGWDEEDYGHNEFIIDQDAFLVKNQQGKLTDDQLDSLLVETDPTYSLWPIEKEADEDA